MVKTKAEVSSGVGKPAKSEVIAPSQLLTCPVRGPLNAAALAADGLTVSEEARRIDLINLLLQRGYPKQNMSPETIIVSKLGESGRNKLRADLIVYDQPAGHLQHLAISERLKHAILVAEVKRDSKSKKAGVTYQLEPAMRLLPSMSVLGVYWDDIHQLLFTKKTEKKDEEEVIVVRQDDIANLPPFGVKYKIKPITLDSLVSSTNLMGVLFSIANVLRSHKINDEHTRYKETVKLILARYCDERDAASQSNKQLSLQVLPGADPKFLERVGKCYDTAAKRYPRAETLFKPTARSSLSEAALRDAVKAIQGIQFSKASSEVMQQVFMSFVPAVFKKSLDQYFTPLSLIEAMVDLVRIGPNDIVADPAMGTADFLTAAMASRLSLGEEDIIHRLRGADADPMAFDLAIVNMILHKDGQSGFLCEDSIEHHKRWAGEVDVALCNPPFGENSVERRHEVLKHYDLGHEWEQDQETKAWSKTDRVLPSQQLGILFIEKCFKLLSLGGRLAIILPEGYRCTASYGYVRRWILDNLRILCLVELPRRIFTRSEADLRGNILVAQRLSKDDLDELKKRDYPIQAELVRRVGFKMGKGFSIIAKRDELTGAELRDPENKLIVDTDFQGIRERFSRFCTLTDWESAISKQPKAISGWRGGTVSTIVAHENLDMKPRRLTTRALENVKAIHAGAHIRLEDIADVLIDTIDLSDPDNAVKSWRLVEGIDIRAVEGVVVPQLPARAWMIVERKQRNVFRLQGNDIIVGLVRPERRNIGLLIDDGDDLVGSPDGVAVVRIKPEAANQLTTEWLFASLRSEKSRLQLWTESGGTSYGKLTRQHILNVVLPEPSKQDVQAVSGVVNQWAKHMRSGFEAWQALGTPEDRRPIINSPIFGLEADEDA